MRAHRTDRTRRKFEPPPRRSGRVAEALQGGRQGLFVALDGDDLVAARRAADQANLAPRDPERLGEGLQRSLGRPAVDGPLASVRGEAPEDLDYDGAAEHLQTVWIAVRASLRAVVDELTLADVVAGRLPDNLRRLIDAPDAWSRR